MSMKLKFVNVFEAGKQYARLEAFRILPKEKLPVEYVTGFPAIYYEEETPGKLYIATNDGLTIDLQTGQKVTMENLAAVLRIARHAGERLKKINDAKTKYKNDVDGKKIVRKI